MSAMWRLEPLRRCGTSSPPIKGIEPDRFATVGNFGDAATAWRLLETSRAAFTSSVRHDDRDRRNT